MNAPTVTITAGGNNVVNEAAPYTRVSEYTRYQSGQYQYCREEEQQRRGCKPHHFSRAKEIYTILLVGKPGAADAKPTGADKIYWQWHFERRQQIVCEEL